MRVWTLGVGWIGGARHSYQPLGAGGKLASCWRLSLRKKRFRRLHSVTAKAIKGKVAALMSESIDRTLTKLFIPPVVGLLTYLACKKDLDVRMQNMPI